MGVEDAVAKRIEQLIAEAPRLSACEPSGQALTYEQCQDCSAWLTSAQNVVYLVCESSSSPYRAKADHLAQKSQGWFVCLTVGEMAAVLKSLLADAQAGLLASVADRARAQTFDDFLGHAEAYLKDKRKNESGAIAGVVFEDIVRRVCAKRAIPEQGVKLDSLISQLASQGELSGVKAKRARAAADVRTKATHAQWEEFELEDVRATIEFTRELIASKLDS